MIKERIWGSIPFLPRPFFFQANVLAAKEKSSPVTIFSCNQRFELINFDGCCVIATSARLILFSKGSKTRSLWLNILLWPIIFIKLFLYFLFFFCLDEKGFVSKPYQNVFRQHNWARNALWDFSLLVGSVSRFSWGFRLKRKFWQ